MQRALGVGRIDRPHVHAVLGQRPGLVGGDHGDGPEGLDGTQAAHHRLALGEPLDAHGECQGQHRRQPLRHGGDGECHREQHDLAQPADAFDDEAAERQQQPDAEDRDRDLVAELAETALERERRPGSTPPIMPASRPMVLAAPVRVTSM